MHALLYCSLMASLLSRVGKISMGQKNFLTYHVSFTLIVLSVDVWGGKGIHIINIMRYHEYESATPLPPHIKISQ